MSGNVPQPPANEEDSLSESTVFADSNLPGQPIPADLAPNSSVNDQPMQRAAPEYLGVLLWIGITIILSLPALMYQLDSSDDFGTDLVGSSRASAGELLGGVAGTLITTTPFLAGYYLRSKWTRLGCLGLIILGAVVTFIGFRSLDNTDSDWSVLFLALALLFGLWVMCMALLGLVASAGARRFYRHRRG